MKYVHKLCYDEITEKCSIGGHLSIAELTNDTEKCVKDSFEGPNYKTDDNYILREEAKKWKEIGSGYWPSVVINNRTYRGDLIPDAVFNALCAAFSNPPSYCRDVQE